MGTRINIREGNKSFLENFLRTQRVGVSWSGEIPKDSGNAIIKQKIPDVVVTSSSPSEGYIGSYEKSMNAIKELPKEIMILNKTLERGLEMDLKHLATSEKMDYQEYQKIVNKYGGQN